MMRTRMAATTLALEAFLVFFAALAALPFSIAADAVIWGVGIGGAVLCLVAAMLCVRHRSGIPLGWLIQIGLLALGIWVKAMIVMGLIFLAMWAWLLWVGAKIDRDRANWAPQEDTADTAGEPRP